MKLLLSSLLTTVFIFNLNLTAQEAGWHLGPADPGSSVGISANKLYSEILKNKNSQAVVVAVIDSGVDVEHEDLRANVWINEDEIPDNGIDDDNNGYIDDIHGWNFIGGTDGRNVGPDTYEVTRLYGKLKYKYENANPAKLSKKDKKEYELFLKYKEEVEKEIKNATSRLENIKRTEENLMNSLDAIDKAIGEKELSFETLKSIDGQDKPSLAMGKNILLDFIARGEELVSIDSLKAMIGSDIADAMEYYQNKVDFAYNPDFDTREIVGDDYTNQEERYYGNNDVEGPDASHGTHVAGIIAAVRDNNIGIDGIAKNAQIMAVRAVPDGDERDKDVANAIRYAVDNGASVINMSFGKGYSWDEKVVEDAIKYAADNDVLLIHAAGNSSQDNDSADNFPNDEYQGKGFLFFKGKKKNFNNWLEIGALNYKTGEELPAPFSNYGSQNVDLFAPGMSIHSTMPNDEYQPMQGTSMASPVVAGVAAVLRSYFPSLTAVQVKKILMASVSKQDTNVFLPGDKSTLVPFSQLSVTGGVINAEKAVKLAEQTKGEKKLKVRKDKV